MASQLRRLRKSQTMLFVIDVQGKLAEKVTNSALMLRRMEILVGGCHELGIRTLWFEQVPDKLGDTAPVIKAALERAGAMRFAKHTFSCLGTRATPTQAVLDELHASAPPASRPANSVILCGIESHICVMQTALDLVERGFDVHVAADAVSSVRELDMHAALRRIASAGATVSTVEMALFELMEEANLTPGSAFRTITKSLM